MPQPFATKESTKDYFTKQKTHPDKIKNWRGLAVSGLAMGSYLGDCNAATDKLLEDAFIWAGQNGLNFFDTALNYRCQRSEKNLAYAIRKLAALGIFRDSLVISSKAGFLPAEGDPAQYKEYILKSFLNTGLIQVEDIKAHCHCMTPAFLKTCLNLSLNNLKLKSIDLYYLHNPETQLTDLLEDEFYKKLTEAFAFFEQSVADGLIQSYGVATWNGFRVPFGTKGYLDLKKVLKAAKEASGSGESHLTTVQLPCNLAMLEAVGLNHQKTANEEAASLVKAAVDAGLFVCLSAPLMQSHVLNLPQKIFESFNTSLTPAQNSLNFAASLPGITSAIVGMKSKEHLLENMKILEEPALPIETLQNVAQKLVTTPLQQTR